MAGNALKNSIHILRSLYQQMIRWLVQESWILYKTSRPIALWLLVFVLQYQGPSEDITQ